MDDVLAVLDEELLDGAAERLHVGAEGASVLHQVRVHVGPQHVPGTEISQANREENLTHSPKSCTG